MDPRSIYTSLIFLCLFIGNCKSQTATAGLKDAYEDYFPIGASISPRNIQSDDTSLILREFNSITAENVMKMGLIHPAEQTYNWSEADQMAAFAARHVGSRPRSRRARGHTLCWHNQVGEWMFQDDAGNVVTKDVLLHRLKAHVDAVASRYKGQIYAWDVVNEVISDEAGQMFRESQWYKICGEDFIYKAFEYAHAADPDALLFYNDYNATMPGKRDKIIRLLKEIQRHGVPLHGMGIQGHWSIYEPAEEQIRDAIRAYADLGLQVQITELDISVYKPESGRRRIRPDESDLLTPEQEARQLDRYAMIFNVFRDFRDKLTGVTFWNVTDADSWLNNHPVYERDNYPLLFDRDRQRKPVYYEIFNF